MTDMTAPSIKRPYHKLRRTFSVILLPLLLCLVTVAAPAVAEAALPEFQASYTLRRNGVVVGEMKLELSRMPDGSYRYSSVSRATGLIAWFYGGRVEEYSIWRMVDDRPRPLEYHYFHNKRKHHRHVDIDFDWTDLHATNKVNNDPWKMPIPPSAQDKLVYQLTLMQDLSAGKKDLDYQIADGGVLKDYHFDMLGAETIKTPLGPLSAEKLVREGDKRNTTLWCAEALQYLPIRISQTDTDGSHLSLDIDRINGLDLSSTP
ncbi:MAG: DUF3108 domain-containing protein [Gammaproteobacteria bacterium]|nr:DUF3108 domain-containing protein [Gammaproteobacteria bacterium]